MISNLIWAIVLVTKLHISNAKVINDDLVVSLIEPRSAIRGHLLKSTNGNNYYAFQDIPYARPPVGNLRFEEPQPHPGWTGILNTTTNTKFCMQEGLNGTEDCLIINVFTPIKPGSGKLPVLFWIHGGGYDRGFCSMVRCGPKHYVDYGIVVVTCHYRVGAFGFLTTEDGVIPGNIGLKDQALALKWVNKNIAVFGGDPSKVTIGGNSAGAISVGSHIISQKVKGLYRAAIMQSGSALVSKSYISTARNDSFQMGKILQPSFNSTNSVRLLQILRAASSKEILLASQKVNPDRKAGGLLHSLVWGIVLEKHGKFRYLTEPMHQSLLLGTFDKVPMLIGHTSEEILGFIASVDQLKAAAANRDENDSSLISANLNVPGDRVTIAGTTLKRIYTKTTFYDDLASFVTFSSEVDLISPTIRHAALSSKHVPVFLYEFCYKGNAHRFNLSIPNVEGIAHNEDVSYTWARMELTKPEDRNLSRTLLTLWTNFIKTLNPTPSSSDSVLGNFSWPQVTDSVNMEYLKINSTLGIKTGPRRYKAVKEWFQQYSQKPYMIF